MKMGGGEGGGAAEGLNRVAGDIEGSTHRAMYVGTCRVWVWGVSTIRGSLGGP